MAGMSDLITGARNAAGRLATRVSDGLSGLRGSASTAGTPPPADPVGPIPAAAEATPPLPTIDPEFSPPQGAQNPNVGPGKMSAEAQDFLKSRAGGGAPPAAVPPSTGGLRASINRIGGSAGKLSKLARGAGAVQAGYGLYQGVKANNASQLGDASDNVFNGVATTLAPPVGIAGTALAGLRDKVMQWGADKLYGTNKTITPQTRALMAQGVGQGSPAVAPPQSAADTAVNTDQGPQSPEQVISGNAVPTPGEGAIKVGANPARGLRGNTGAVTGSADAPDALEPLRGLASKGPMGGLAALGVYGALSRTAKNEADLGIKSNAARLAAYKQGYEIAKDQRDFSATRHDKAFDQGQTNMKNNNDAISSYVQSKVGAQGTMEKGDTYKNRVAQANSDVMGRVNFTLANHGMTLQNADPAHIQHLLLANDMRERVENARGSLPQSMRDFFGGKRADSRDLYSYTPTSVTSAGLPGQGSYVVKMGNGNTVGITRLANGGWNLTGANEPVDADIMKMVQPLIQQYDKGRK